MSLFELAATQSGKLAINDLSTGAVWEIRPGEARRLFANLHLQLHMGRDPHVAFTTDKGIEAWLQCPKEEALDLAARIDRCLKLGDAMATRGYRA